MPMTALLAERRAALRSIDIEALQRRAAALGNRPAPAPWAASLAAGNAAALARMSSHAAAAKQLQPKPDKETATAGTAAASPRRAASPCAGTAAPSAPATRRVAGAEQLRSASPGTKNVAALARISCHDASAAQLQCQLAAEAAAFVSARALRSTRKYEGSGITAAPSVGKSSTSVESPPVAEGNPFAQAEAAAVAWVSASTPQRTASGELSMMGSMPSVMLPALAGENPFALASGAAVVATPASSALERTASEEETSKAGSQPSVTLPALAVTNPFAQAALHPTTQEEELSQSAAAPPGVATAPPTVQAVAEDAPILKAMAAASGDNRVQEGKDHGQKDRPVYSRPLPHRRSGSQPSGSRTSLAVVKEHDAEQHWQHALDDDSAEFYVVKPAEQPLVRMETAVPVYRASVNPPASPFDRQTEDQIPASPGGPQGKAKSEPKAKPGPLKRSKAVEKPRVVRESSAEQQGQNALDDDSAEFYVVKPAQQPLARMASSLAFEFPTLSRPDPPLSAAASVQPEKLSSTSGSPPPGIKPAHVKSLKEEVPATPRAAPEKGNALKEGVRVPATPVKKPAAPAAWEPTTPGHGSEPPPAAAKSECKCFSMDICLNKSEGVSTLRDFLL